MIPLLFPLKRKKAGPIHSLLFYAQLWDINAMFSWNIRL